MKIRTTGPGDLDAVMAVERAAFAQESEAELVRNLLADPTARPLLSLLAEEEATPVGHILFTAGRVEGTGDAVATAILAPLAVVPDAQGKGIGRRLVEDGLRRLAGTATALVFVLGDPAYYGRFGFVPAGPLGLVAPYPLPAAWADAWRVRALRDGIPGTVRGRVACADALARPEYWQE